MNVVGGWPHAGAGIPLGPACCPWSSSGLIQAIATRPRKGGERELLCEMAYQPFQVLGRLCYETEQLPSQKHPFIQGDPKVTQHL